MQASINGIRMTYDVAGAERAPVVVLHHPLATNLSIWDEITPVLAGKYRVVRFDARGHGQTEAPKGPYTFETLAADVVGLMDHLKIKTADFLGLSMGGMVGQWLGANAPERFGKIILSNTACHYPDPTNWLTRIKAVKEGGIAAVADTVIAGWLTADFREREPQIAANMKAMLLASPVQGYLACCEALSTLDQRALLPKIKSPTLVIAGRHDTATPVAAGELIRSQIPGASLTILDAAHISNVEQPHAFTDAVVGFLTQR